MRDSKSKKKEFAELLLAWRTKHDWSREEAAAKLGVSYRTLQEWEQGRRVKTNRLSTIVKLKLPKPMGDRKR